MWRIRCTGIDAQDKADGIGAFVSCRIAGAGGQKVGAVAQCGRRRKLPAAIYANKRFPDGIAVVVEGDSVACGAVTAQPGLGFWVI